MTWLINTFPWLSFIAIVLGYLGLLITAVIVLTILVECYKDWRRDCDLARRIQKVDVEMREKQERKP